MPYDEEAVFLNWTTERINVTHPFFGVNMASLNNTPANLRLPSTPTAKVVFTSSCRRQTEGLDEFDLEAGRDAAAMSGASAHRGRARKVVRDLKDATAR